jgi:type II secretory pathway pseudopilin PulG
MKTTRTISYLKKTRRKAAFTLVESMLLVGILGMSAAVVGQSMSTMVTSATTNNLILLVNDQLLSQMEYLRANYKSMSIGSSTQSVTLNNVSYTMTSDIEDANPGGGTQSTFLSLTVSLNGQKMTTYVSN